MKQLDYREAVITALNKKDLPLLRELNTLKGRQVYYLVEAPQELKTIHLVDCIGFLYADNVKQWLDSQWIGICLGYKCGIDLSAFRPPIMTKEEIIEINAHLETKY